MASGAWIQCSARGIVVIGCATATLGLLTFSAAALAVEYSAEAIEARVIDARSQSPLEGVIVVAHWQLEGGLEGGNVLGQVKVLETETDVAGTFKFPAWGPVPIPKGLPSNARLKDHDPEIILFKPGYKFVHVQNAKTLEQTRSHAPYVRTSDWNHKTIAMTPVSGDVDEMAKDILGLDSFIGFATDQHSRCAWQSMPKMIEAGHKYRKEIEIRGKKISGWFVDQDLMANDQGLVKAGCDSPNQFFDGRLK